VGRFVDLRFMTAGAVLRVERLARQGIAITEIADTVDAFFTECTAEVLSLGADDFKHVLTAAAAGRAAD